MFRDATVQLTLFSSCSDSNKFFNLNSAAMDRDAVYRRTCTTSSMIMNYLDVRVCFDPSLENVHGLVLENEGR